MTNPVLRGIIEAKCEEYYERKLALIQLHPMIADGREHWRNLTSCSTCMKLKQLYEEYKTFLEAGDLWMSGMFDGVDPLSN